MLRGCYPSIASPVLVGDKAVYGGLDGGAVRGAAGRAARRGPSRTAFGKAISAPAAVCDGRIYFGCEDGYLYVLGPGGKARRCRRKDLRAVEDPQPACAARWPTPQYDWFTSFGDWGNTNADDQRSGRRCKLQWIRRYEGHGQALPRLRRRPDVHAHGRRPDLRRRAGDGPAALAAVLPRRPHLLHLAALLPRAAAGAAGRPAQSAGSRCLDAATGNLVWEAPFSGSPSWNRQQPPVVYKNLAIYMFGTGRTGPRSPRRRRVHWLFGHQDVPGFPASHRPLLRAYDLRDGQGGVDQGFLRVRLRRRRRGRLPDGRPALLLLLLRPRGQAALRRSRARKGITAAIEPETGRSSG